MSECSSGRGKLGVALYFQLGKRHLIFAHNTMMINVPILMEKSSFVLLVMLIGFWCLIPCVFDSPDVYTSKHAGDSA